jgi:hypothetical protein
LEEPPAFLASDALLELFDSRTAAAVARYVDFVDRTAGV